MKTREEFISRWRHHLAGLALYGVTSELRDGPVARAAKVYEITGEVERMLERMYRDLVEVPASGTANGLTNGQVRAKT